jgi:hypothetical protein
MRAYTTDDYSGLRFSPNDDTNYILGIPCSINKTLQDQTRQSIVTYRFEAKVENDRKYKNSQCIPEIRFLMNSVFFIQVIVVEGVIC